MILKLQRFACTSRRALSNESRTAKIGFGRDRDIIYFWKLREIRTLQGKLGVVANRGGATIPKAHEWQTASKWGAIAPAPPKLKPLSRQWLHAGGKIRREKKLTPNNAFGMLKDSNPVRFIAMTRIEEREVNVEGLRSHRFPRKKPQALFSCRKSVHCNDGVLIFLRIFSFVITC